MTLSPSLRRYGAFMRLDLLTNRRAYLYGLLGLLIGNLACDFAIFYLPLLQGYELPYEAVNQFKLNIRALNFWLVALVSFLLSCSNAFDSLRTKRQRTYWLMVPATTAERFWGLITTHVGGMAAGMVVTFVVTDLLRYAVTAAFMRDNALCSVYVVRQLCQLDLWHAPGTLLAVCSVAAALLSLGSCYLLGGAYFRRKPFLKVSALLFIWTLAFSGFVIRAGRLSGVSLGPVENLTGMGREWIGIALSLCWTAACTWLAYRAYRRTPIVRRRLFKFF